MHITYDVEIGDAIEMKEIPFVVGVLADLSGKPEDPLPKMKDRKFVEIDRDNFNNVMEGMAPRLAYRVDNKLTNDGSQLAVELKFKNIDDFHPENVAGQVEPLRKLVETGRGCPNCWASSTAMTASMNCCRMCCPIRSRCRNSVKPPARGRRKRNPKARKNNQGGAIWPKMNNKHSLRPHRWKKPRRSSAF